MVHIVCIQAAHVVVHGLVHGILEEVPVQAVIVLPFDELAKFTAHEQELLARMGHPVAVEGAQAGEFLPVVARHLVQKRMFAVDDFIMRQRQDKILGKSIT